MEPFASELKLSNQQLEEFKTLKKESAEKTNEFLWKRKIEIEKNIRKILNLEQTDCIKEIEEPLEATERKKK